MRPTLDNSKYPVFEANQVLTNRHLNQVFNYLDEQARLTRANLIGIGIVCGLETEIAGTASDPLVRIKKGCGITSEGYLIVEPDDIDLVSYRPYNWPADLPYPPFTDATLLWEMFPEGEPNTTLFGSNTPPGFLEDKVVMLFLELKKDGLRNCSPTNCDDRGAEVQVTLRRLLVRKNDPRIAFLIDGTIGTEASLPTVTDLEQEMLADLNLVDIRLPRYSVPAGTLTSSNTVLAAYVSIFRNNSLANRVGTALTAAYHAFEPLVRDIYPANPFSGFGARYAFLDAAPQNITQVRFLQYYYDLFDDLIKAYDEFRWKGAELLCACCPSEGLFRRHLLLGLLRPDLSTANDPLVFRHHFMASSAISGCEAHTKELLLLFRRLVEMTERFTNEPPLFGGRAPENIQQHIRITPSKLGDVPLSEKCIPYYYLQDGTPKLFQLWNTEKSRRKRAYQNLSYRSYQYDQTLPDFVSDPLRFDLEPHNFLRVEGHLGKDYLKVLEVLQDLKKRYRLPVDVIALRTGAFNEDVDADPNMQDCHFQDLETLYDATREQWMGFLCNDLTYLYALKPLTKDSISTSELPEDKEKASLRMAADLPSATTPPPASGVDVATFKPVLFKSKYNFINTYAPDFLVSSDTLGGRFEKEFNKTGLLQRNASVKSEAEQLNNLFLNVFSAIIDLVSTLPQTLKTFKLTDFSKRCAALSALVKDLETSREASSVTGKLKNYNELILWEEIDDRLEDLLYNCRTEVYKSLTDEYARRVKEIKQKQFLSHFLLQHPGIQHKAGVPMGGTFILVYHEKSGKLPANNLFEFEEIQLQNDLTLEIADEALAADENLAARTGREPLFTSEFEAAFKRLQLNESFAVNEDFRLIQGALTGQVVDPRSNYDLLINEAANRIIAQFVNGLSDRTVIADFFLPYLCCSDCAGVQYVLPSAQPTFTFTVLCTDLNDQAEVAIIPQGGTPSYSYKAGTQPYKPLSGNVVLGKGTHTLTLRDAAGTESVPQTIVVQPKISCTTPAYKCAADLKTYTAEFNVSGGTPPYTASRGSIGADNKYVSNPITNGTGDDITILDHQGCKVVVPVIYACVAPLEFTATPKCTAADKSALIDLQIKGGVTPYLLKVDGAAFAAVPVSLKLSTGPHTLILQDQAGTQKTQNIQVADPLVAAVLRDGYLCNKEKTEYVVKINITGGKPPYKVNGIPVEGTPAVYGPVPNGKTETLKITDSLDCVAPPLPIVYRCPRVKPTFDYILFPTNLNNQAKMTLLPGEGVAPFTYQLDGGDFQPVRGSFIVNSGRRTITLKDKEENLSDTKTIDVPPADVPPLFFENVDHRCENGRYRVFFQVTGGAPPYQLIQGDAGMLHDGTFEGIPMPSGAPLVVGITDKAGNVHSREFNFICETACGKPCAGISQKCSYRLWVQPSASRFDVYKPGTVEFTFTDEKGKTQNIPGLSVGVLTELLNSDFNGTMTALILQVNDKIAKVLGEGRVVLSYEPGDTDPFARLWIETFQCEMFNMKFTLDYAQGGPIKEYEVRYMKTEKVNGVLFTNLQIDSAPVQVPVSDCSVRDQCKDTAFEKLCREKLQPVEIKAVTSEGDMLHLSILGTPVPPTTGITWIWEVERSTEAIYTGPEVKVKVPGLAQGTKVKLTGISKSGCVVSATKNTSVLK